MGDLEHAEMESFCGGSKLCSHQRQWSCGGHLGMLSAQQESAPLGGGHDLTNSILLDTGVHTAVSCVSLLPTILLADVPCVLHEYRHQIICILHPAVPIASQPTI